MRNPFRKECHKCIRLKTRMEIIINYTRRIDKIILGNTELNASDTSKIQALNASINIEAMKGEIPK